MIDLELIRTLSQAVGVSGNEEAVRDLILKQLPEGCETEVDPLGNLIVTKKGKNTPKNRVMLCAHMDEVGFIVTYITAEGLIPPTGANLSSPSSVI